MLKDYIIFHMEKLKNYFIFEIKKMDTIKEILLKRWLTLEDIKELYKRKVCNGCGWKGWINFSEIMKALPYFEEWKWKKLFEDLQIVCCLHDYDYFRWNDYIDFTMANIKFCNNIYRLLHWTKFIDKVILYFTVLIILQVKGYKYFNTGNFKK